MDRTELSFINLINLQLTYDRPDLVSARKTTKKSKARSGEGISSKEEYSEVILQQKY